MNQKQHEWDEYFMKIAETVALKSKDPSSKMGCVIVNENRRVVSLGYNGLIQGANENKLTLSERPMKYRFVIHSEMNALLFAREDLRGSTVYNQTATCDNCLKHCLQAGVRRFVYRNLRVNSHATDPEHSMTNYESDEAIIRMLSAMPEVETLNMTNGKTYVEDIIDSYPEDSEERAKLIAWTQNQPLV